MYEGSQVNGTERSRGPVPRNSMVTFLLRIQNPFEGRVGLLFDMLSKNAKNVTLRIVARWPPRRRVPVLLTGDHAHDRNLPLRDRICAVALEDSTPTPGSRRPCPFRARSVRDRGDAVALAEASAGRFRDPAAGRGAVAAAAAHVPTADNATGDRSPRARAIHLTALEGNLPIEDEEILSDLLPAPREGSGLFFAVAARRSVVETRRNISGPPESGWIVSSPTLSPSFFSPRSRRDAADGIYLRR